MASKPILQVVFSFDTTGSMANALPEVRKRISDMVRKLQQDIPGVTTAVVAHGDYCDHQTYVTKHIDFTDELLSLVSFVNGVEPTHGGDFPEAYEAMLRLVRKDLQWKRGSQKLLVVIGDAYPHTPEYQENKNQIDWKQEVRLLAEMGVRIYGVQVADDKNSAAFFRAMAEKTNGFHLTLSTFGSLCDAIMAICYREMGVARLRAYESEVRARDGKTLASDLERIFDVLRTGMGTTASGDDEQIIKSLRDAKLI